MSNVISYTTFTIPDGETLSDVETLPNDAQIFCIGAWPDNNLQTSVYPMFLVDGTTTWLRIEVGPNSAYWSWGVKSNEVQEIPISDRPSLMATVNSCVRIYGKLRFMVATAVTGDKTFTIWYTHAV
jgi:hypothetical protein